MLLALTGHSHDRIDLQSFKAFDKGSCAVWLDFSHNTEDWIVLLSLESYLKCSTATGLS